jgi:hypothetical protein
VVVDTWSQESHLSQLLVDKMSFELCEEFDKLNLRIVAKTEVMKMEVDSTLLQDIRKDQLEDKKIQEIKCNIKGKKSRPDLRKTTKVCRGMKEGFMCLRSRS